MGSFIEAGVELTVSCSSEAAAMSVSAVTLPYSRLTRSCPGFCGTTTLSSLTQEGSWKPMPPFSLCRKGWRCLSRRNSGLYPN